MSRTPVNSIVIYAKLPWDAAHFTIAPHGKRVFLFLDTLKTFQIVRPGHYRVRPRRGRKPSQPEHRRNGDVTVERLASSPCSQSTDLAPVLLLPLRYADRPQDYEDIAKFNTVVFTSIANTHIAKILSVSSCCT